MSMSSSDGVSDLCLYRSSAKECGCAREEVSDE